MSVPAARVHAAGQPGPTVAVCGAVHGDELVGTATCLALDTHLPGRLVAGKVILVPTVNAAGQQQGLRCVPEDGEDLNRHFPKADTIASANPGASERLATATWALLRGHAPDVVLDLHADAARAVPYVVLDRALRQPASQRAALEERCLTLARATGLHVVHDYLDARYARAGLERSLAGAALNVLGCASMTLEVGPRRVVDAASVQIATDAVLRVLAMLGMVAHAPVATLPALPGRFRREMGPRAGAEGLLVHRAAPGERLRAGDVIADVIPSNGAARPVHAVTEGFVLSALERGWVVAETPVCTYAVPEDA